MTHIEQLHLDAMRWVTTIQAAKKSAEITEQIACEFAEFCRDRAVRETIYGSVEPTNNWELRAEQKIVTTKQLFQEYLKSKEK